MHVSPKRCGCQTATSFEVSAAKQPNLLSHVFLKGHIVCGSHYIFRPPVWLPWCKTWSKEKACLHKPNEEWRFENPKCICRFFRESIFSFSFVHRNLLMTSVLSVVSLSLFWIIYWLLPYLIDWHVIMLQLYLSILPLAVFADLSDLTGVTQSRDHGPPFSLNMSTFLFSYYKTSASINLHLLTNLLFTSLLFTSSDLIWDLIARTLLMIGQKHQNN